MSLTNTHPQYDVALPWWEQMLDTYAGERTVKQAGTKYLPATSGHVQDGYPTASTRGLGDYLAYRLRAQFYDSVDDAVGMLLGVMHSKPATFELPAKMQYLIEQASRREESLEQMLRRVNEQQIVTGRLGLLGDVIDEGSRSGQLYMALYGAKLVQNWDQGKNTALEVEALNMVVLDESAMQRDGETFTWSQRDQYRVLMLGEPAVNQPSLSGFTYRTGTFTDEKQFAATELMTPVVNGKAAAEIPFVFINAVDIAPMPSKPPLMGLSDLSLANYRKSADYNLSLFMQGQDTLVLVGAAGGPSGAEEPVRVGAGAQISIPMPSGKAEFIGVNSKGLSEQRTAIENGLAQAQQFASKLVDSATRERESGSALRIRLATRTATLNRLALAGAYGMQTLLRKMARWIGEDPAAVIVTPNLDFVDDSLPPAELVNLVLAKTNGAPISYETIHTVMETRSMTALTFEEEIAKIKAEAELDKLLKPDPEPANVPGASGGSGGGDTNTDD